MDTIIIKDSRDADSYTKEMLLEATSNHKYDVERGMQFLTELILERGVNHDWSKIEYFDDFANTVLATRDNNDIIFKESEWYKRHIGEERHHLNANCPVDVNLIDVLEMIVDCVMAGRSRNGRIDSSFLCLNDPSILIRAYWNTVRLLNDTVTVSNGEI